MLDSIKRQPIALKEWAVSVKALLEGKQVIVLRKGGIVEETRDFEVISPGFYLMPVYEHQKKSLLKAEYANEIDKTLKDWSPEAETIKLDAYAEVADDIEISDNENLDRLRDMHIWTDGFAEERLKWKKTKPLHLLVLRVYRLNKEMHVPMRPAYTGCKSWARLEDALTFPPMSPVMSEERFERERCRIKDAISRIDL